MKTTARSGALLLCLGMLLATGMARAAEDPFQRIKGLEGTWYAADASGAASGQVLSIFRVTANGHVVQEIMFPGTANEMVNMYYRDVDHVLMSHFCAGGNQPVLRVLATPKPGVLQLEYYDISNMVTMNDEHMHEAVFEWLGEDRLRTEWRSFKDGRYLSSSRFDMVRVRR